MVSQSLYIHRQWCAAKSSRGSENIRCPSSEAIYTVVAWFIVPDMLLFDIPVRRPISIFSVWLLLLRAKEKKKRTERGRTRSVDVEEYMASHSFLLHHSLHIAMSSAWQEERSVGTVKYCTQAVNEPHSPFLVLPQPPPQQCQTRFIPRVQSPIYTFYRWTSESRLAEFVHFRNLNSA